ncbi:SSI family serine proteinase inhibitor [Streptomyces sp. NPDC059909]|uniref:SSI family serine proteinase inhibitor n=1 Tax=Streptomyces sp. NPDC059909 TaxID=3346998 RepID=UPI0036593BD5
MLRRFAFTAVATATASVAALVVAAPASSASVLGPLPLPLLQPEEPQDRLTLITADTGNPMADGTYELTCGPVGGTHPEAEAACDRLEELRQEGEDPFASVSRDAMCTQMYGGPATAHVTGTWRGRTVDATFDRSNGCEIARWQTLEPVLPTARV